MIEQELEFTGERLIPKQASLVTFWEHIYRYRFALNYVKGKSVLDIASGEGYGTAALSKAGVKEIIGIDISEEACRHAAKKYGLDYQTGDAQAIQLQPNSLDTIISFETIEHLEFPGLFLKECARILRSDGKLIFSTPNAISALVKRDNEFHKHLFSIGDLNELIGDHFCHVKVFSQCPETLSFLSARYLACLRSPLNRFNKYNRIINALKYLMCKHIVDLYLANYYREHPVEAILEKDTIFSRFVNPYQVKQI